MGEYARQRGFDTVFSFDVLEHLPDLPGELSFLSSLLNPGGVFVFDVPAGSTKAHPMHLNHNLNVLAFMRANGGFLRKVDFEKQVADGRQMVVDRRKSFDKAAGTALGSLKEQVIKVVADIASKEKYDVVLSRQDVIVAVKPMDITDEVLKGLDGSVTKIDVKFDK